jgi:hypothetical protein
LSDLSPFDYRGLKIGFAGWLTLMLGAAAVVFADGGWPAAIVVAAGFALMGTGLVMHWRAFLRQDREGSALHRQEP